MPARPLSAAGRPLRLCDTCLAVDDHPRHVYATSGATGDRVTYTDEARERAFALAGDDANKFKALAIDLPDDATQMKHLDCCLADGCPDGTCQRKLDDPKDPFDGGKTVGAPLVSKYEEFVKTVTPPKLPGGVPPEGLNDPEHLREQPHDGSTTEEA